MAVAGIDVDGEIAAHRTGMGNPRDRGPEIYGALTETPAVLQAVAGQ